MFYFLSVISDANVIVEVILSLFFLYDHCMIWIQQSTLYLYAGIYTCMRRFLPREEQGQSSHLPNILFAFD